MVEEKGLMPADIPDWIREAEEAMTREGTLDMSEVKEISVKFGKGLVGEPSTSKGGKESIEAKIPNTDPTDKTLWAFFVISPKVIYDNKFGRDIRMKLPENGTTRVPKPFIVTTDPSGQRRWDQNVRDIPNTELKSIVEAYKTKDRTGDRESALDSLKERREEAVLQLGKPKPPYVKSKRVERQMTWIFPRLPN